MPSTGLSRCRQRPRFIEAGSQARRTKRTWSAPCNPHVPAPEHGDVGMGSAKKSLASEDRLAKVASEVSACGGPGSCWAEAPLLAREGGQVLAAADGAAHAEQAVLEDAALEVGLSLRARGRRRDVHTAACVVGMAHACFLGLLVEWGGALGLWRGRQLDRWGRIRPLHWLRGSRRRRQRRDGSELGRRRQRRRRRLRLRRRDPRGHRR